jgi:signal transduction histidine kinase
MSYRLLLIGLLISFFTGAGQSLDSVLIVNQAQDVYGLNPTTYFLKDRTGMSFSDVFKRSDFTPLNSSLYYFSQDKDVKNYWLRSDIDNRLGANFHCQFYFLTGLDSVILYRLSGNKVETSSTGVLVPTANRLIYLSQELALPVVLSPGINRFYFQILNKSTWSKQRGAILLNLAEERSFLNYFLEYRHYHGIALGMMVVMLAFNFFIYLFFKDRTYLHFLMSITVSLVFLVFMKHYHEEMGWLGSALPYIRYVHDPMGVLVAITSLLFSQSFLNTKQTDKVMHRLMNILIVILGLDLLCVVTLQFLALMNQLSMVLGIVTSVLVIVTSIRSIAKGNRLAWYILAGFLFIFLVPIMYILQFLGQFPFRSVASDFHYFGEAFRSVIFAAGIADRFYGLKKEAALQLIEKQKLQIEKERQLRKERERIARELHDNIGSQLTTITFGLDRLSREKNFAQAVTEIQGISRKTINELRDTIWTLDRESFFIDDLEQRINSLFWQYQKTDVPIEMILQINGKDHQILSSLVAGNVFRIIQEAVQNSVKHSDASQITVVLKVDGSTMTLHIRDNGKGFDWPGNEEQDHFGLRNMQKRAEQMNATFKINSSPGEGVSISILVADLTASGVAS